MINIDEEKLLKTLNDSKCIAFPTETVMGLGIFFDDYKAYLYLNKIKNRPENKPYTLMLKDVSEIEKYANLNYFAKKIIKEFMPGPITILLEAKDNVANYITHNTGIIGIRVPNHETCRRILNIAKKPLLVPSANKSNEPPLTLYKDVKKVFKDEVLYVVEEDSLKHKPSTILDLSSNCLKVVRNGNLSIEEIRRRLKMRISVGSDHGGFLYKEEIKKFLINKGYEVVDEGTYNEQSCNYPDFAYKVSIDIKKGLADYGVLVCTSGEGVCMCANKVKGIRCGLGYNDEVSALMRQHNDANIIAFGQKFMSLEDVLRRVEIFLHSDFLGGRHQVRIDLMKDIEDKNL